MDPKRGPIDGDQETSAQQTDESPEPVSDEASTTPSDLSQDAGVQDSINALQDEGPEALADDVAAVESFAELPDGPDSLAGELVETAETGAPFFPLLAADSPSAFGELDAPPDPFASDPLAGAPVDVGRLAETTSGQWFAGAGVPATVARSVETAPAAEPVIGDLVARPGDPVRIERGPHVPNLHQPTAGIEQLFDAQAGSESPPPQSGSTGYEPLGMVRPLVLVDYDDPEGFIRDELDAFSERMTDIGKQTAEAAVRYAEWVRWTEERRLNPELR